jgi:hypothetical protein
MLWKEFNSRVVERSDISYLTEVLIKDGEVQVVPYEFFREIPNNHIIQFCVEHGVYCLPTTELIDFLKQEIEGHKTIEIGSGNGVIARALGIMGTDSKMQELAEIKQHYSALGQVTVNYGKDVISVDGEKAVSQYKPDIVIAAWVTHKYNPKEHYRHGNMYGVKEDKIINKVKKYIFIGNEDVHKTKPILDKPHGVVRGSWLVSRAFEPEKNVIWIWEK